MSAKENLLRHSLSYFFGRAAVLLAGLISLPLMTRLLSKEDYGIMSLVFLAIALTTSLSAFGFPQSTTRFFAEYAYRSRNALMDFCSTMTFASAIVSVAAMVVVSVASLALMNTQSFTGMATHLQYAVVLILLRVVSSVVLQIFRGNGQTFAFNLFNIATRYLSIGVIVLLIVYVYHDVTAVFAGTIYVETAILCVALIYLHRNKLLGWTRPDQTAIQRAVRFGMPLVFADLMVSLVASSDRFVIQYFLGPDSVAVYSVAYDVSDYVAIIFASPLQLAILPIVYSMWSSEGEELTQAFLGKAVNLTLIMVIPMIAGFSVVGPDIVTTLASEKYAESGDLVPFVALGVMLGSINFLFFTGLLLHEKTRIIAFLNCAAAFANLVLNIVLVPRFGIIGAACATSATYLLLNIVTFFRSSRYLALQMDWPMILKGLLAAAAMTLVIWHLDDLSGYKIINALIRTLIGAAIYLGALYMTEAQLREVVRELLSRFYR